MLRSSLLSLRRPRLSSTRPLSSLHDRLVELGVTAPDLQQGILQALESVYGRNVQVSHLDELGPSGLQALLQAVQVEQQKQQSLGVAIPTKRIQIRVPHHGFEFFVDWKQGTSLLDLAKGPQGMELLGEYMEGTCGGQMSCCTCHVYVNLPQVVSDAEQDMLDLAYEPTEASRLGCQVVLDEALLQSDDDIVVTIPAGVNNVWN